MTELTFIRHGETDWNRQLRFQGHIDVPLNATGHRQAALLAARLAGTPPDAFFTSDLQRARETASPLASAWGMTPRLLPGVREQNYGVFEGLDLPAILAQHPQLWAQWQVHHADFALPGGESLRQFSARVLATVERVALQEAGRRVAVVTHGGVLDMLWRSAHGIALDGRRDCAIPNTGISRLHWAAGVLRIDTWGDDSHLAAST